MIFGKAANCKMRGSPVNGKFRNLGIDGYFYISDSPDGQFVEGR
jgi:hypothetical protein